MTRLLPQIALLTVSVIFGANYVIAKIALSEISPLALVGIRVFFAALILTILHRVFVKESITEKRDFLLLGLYALLGVVINQICFLYGLSLTTAINASIIITTIPVITVVVAVMISQERFSLRRGLGIATALAGTLIIMRIEEIDFSDRYFVGNLFVFINCCAYGSYLVFAKKLLNKYHPSTVITWVFTFGVLGVMPFGVPALAETDFSAVSFGVWLCVGYVILMPSVVSYWMNMWALKRVDSSVVAIYVYVQPVVAVFLSITFLDETLTLRAVVSALIIFLGVFWVSFGGKSGLF